jgi:hypothetical protein
MPICSRATTTGTMSGRGASLEKTLEVSGLKAGGLYLLQGDGDEGILRVAAHTGEPRVCDWCHAQR